MNYRKEFNRRKRAELRRLLAMAKTAAENLGLATTIDGLTKYNMDVIVPLIHYNMVMAQPFKRKRSKSFLQYVPETTYGTQPTGLIMRLTMPKETPCKLTQ